jgi:hypothetical protein
MNPRSLDYCLLSDTNISRTETAMMSLTSSFSIMARRVLLGTFSLLVLLGASSGASAIVFGPGQTLSFDYDLSSSSTLGTNDHTLTVELFETTPTSAGGTYYLSYQVETANGVIVDVPALEISGGGNPGPLSAVATLISNDDLLGTVSLSLSGLSGLNDVTSATMTITDGDGSERGIATVTTFSVETTAVPAPATLGLLLIGLAFANRRESA